MKTLTTLVALALGAMSIFAQDETKDQTDKALQSAQTRLPEDQPRATSPSPAANSPGTTTEATPATAQPNEAELMKQMAEMSKLNENHKLLTGLNGNWTFKIKFWMNPNPSAPPQA